MSKLLPARITFLPESEGGRSNPALPGIRPHLRMRDIFTSAVVHSLGDVRGFQPGVDYDVVIEILFWDDYAARFDPSEGVELYDGSRLIAKGSWTTPE